MVRVAPNGLILNYSEIGTGSKTPVLIMHGWGRNGGEWTRMGQALADWSKRKIYILDLPGFGGSGTPKASDIYEYAKIITGFTDYIGLKKLIVIGHSLGGRVGILLGAKYPVLVEKLILIDPAGIKTMSLKRIFLKSLSSIFRFVPQKWRRIMSDPWMDEDYRADATRRILYRIIVAADLRPLIHQIACPVGIIWGERDPILPLSQTKIYRRELQTSIVRIVWGAGHDPHQTHFDQTRKILEEMVE